MRGYYAIMAGSGGNIRRHKTHLGLFRAVGRALQNESANTSIRRAASPKSMQQRGPHFCCPRRSCRSQRGLTLDRALSRDIDGVSHAHQRVVEHSALDFDSDARLGGFLRHIM